MKVRMKIKLNNNSFIYCLLWGLMFIQVFRPLRVPMMVSVGTWLIIFVTLINFGVNIFFRKYVDRYFLLLLLLSVVTILSMMISGNISYQAIVVMMCFLEIPLFVSAQNRIDNMTHKAIYMVFVILGIFYIVQGCSAYAYLYETEYGERIINSLTLGYYNPNETALHLTVCNIVLLSLLYKVKKRYLKILLISEIVTISYYILLTQSRIAILTLVFFIIMLIIYCRRKSNKIPKLLVDIVLFIPVIFVFVTMRFSELMNSKMFLGDYLETGRYEIFGRVFENMTVQKFLFGDYNFRFENLHNGLLSVFGTIGIIGATVFCMIICKKIFEVFDRGVCGLECKVALIGILCIILLSSTEAALIVSGGAFYVEVVAVFMLAEGKVYRENIVNKYSI